MPPFEEIDHTADRAFRVSAPSRESLFAEAAEALYHVGGLETEPVAEKFRTVRLRADDPESLLILWLNELVYLLDRERLALREIRIERLTDAELEAAGREAGVRSVGKYIKAATYSGLKITRQGDLWQATIVLDV
jgi:SHS2 domain-containing protein